MEMSKKPDAGNNRFLTPEEREQIEIVRKRFKKVLLETLKKRDAQADLGELKDPEHY